MANQQRDAEKERFWRKAIRRQAASGLAVRVFGRQEGLSEPSIYAWRRTIRERDGDLSQAPAFVPAVVSDREADDPAIVMEWLGGRWLKESRRVLTRFEKSAVNFLAMVKWACVKRYLRIMGC